MKTRKENNHCKKFSLHTNMTEALLKDQCKISSFNFYFHNEKEIYLHRNILETYFNAENSFENITLA